MAMIAKYDAPTLTVQRDVVVRTTGGRSNTYENTTNDRTRSETGGDLSGASNSFASEDD
jgi:hypothetical protein